MVGRNPPAVPFAMANDHPIFQGIEGVLLAQLCRKLNSSSVNLLEILRVGQSVLTDLKGNVGVVGAFPARSPPGVPTAAIPGESLYHSHAAVRQLSYEGVDAHIQVSLVPVVAVGIGAQGGLQARFPRLTIQGLNVTAQARVVGPRRMNHHAFGHNGAPRLVAVIPKKHTCVLFHP